MLMKTFIFKGEVCMIVETTITESNRTKITSIVTLIANICFYTSVTLIS